MNIKKLLFKAALLAALSTVLSSTGYAYSPAQYSAATKALRGVPAPELPAKASSWVAKADKKERKDVAVATTKAAIAMNRAAARLIVAAITRVAPESADAVTAAAIAAAPEEKGYIAGAATLTKQGVVSAQAVSSQSAVTPAASARPGRVAPPTEGGFSFFNSPINTNNRQTSDADNDGQNEGNNDNQPQNNFPNPSTNPPKPPPNPPAPAPNGYRRH